MHRICNSSNSYKIFPRLSFYKILKHPNLFPHRPLSTKFPSNTFTYTSSRCASTHPYGTQLPINNDILTTSCNESPIANENEWHKINLIYQMCNGDQSFQHSSWMHKYILNPFKLNFSSYFTKNALSNARHNLRKGGEFSLIYLSEILSTNCINPLTSTCDRQLYRYIEEGVTSLSNNRYKLHFEVSHISAASVDHVWLIVGCEHGCCIERKDCKRLFDYLIVLEDSDAMHELQRRSRKQFFINLLNRGMILLCDVAIVADQKLYVEDERGHVLLGDRDLCRVEHVMRFESAFTAKERLLDFVPPTFPHVAKLGEIDLEAGELQWTLMDFNGCLGGNFPIKFKE